MSTDEVIYDRKNFSLQIVFFMSELIYTENLHLTNQLINTVAFTDV